MNLSSYNWQYRPLPEDWQQQVEALQSAGLSYTPAFLRLCLARGLSTVEAIQAATNPQPQLFHDPFALYDMDRTIERLQAAIEAQELIMIYGDYDADGITSTLILYEALEQLGANVTYYLPNRLVDGYGPNLARFQAMIESGVELILTCDNGVAGFEAIAYAMSQGVDVIVSDHHELQATLPEAYAIVHPKHPKGRYPFTELSGAGVALKIATALLEEVPVELIELAAIGTVSDMVSLTDENRTIVLNGLRLMAETERVGLRLLLEDAKVEADQLNADTIGFVIGPRLNAIGRLGDPTPALSLLQTHDEDEAATLLAVINQKNEERKTLVEQIMQEITAKLALAPSVPDVIIEASEKWPAGVLGIVAGRLMERYHRPALIFQYQADKGWYKGSARSVEAIHIFDWLTSIHEEMHQFGGHAQAAGMTVLEAQWETFKTRLQEVASQALHAIQQVKTLPLDLMLDVADVTIDLIKEFDLLQPFGMDNPKPMVAIASSELATIRMIGTTQQHTKMSLKSMTQPDVAPLNVIGFNCAERLTALQVGSTLKVAGTLQLNVWQSQVSPQLMLKDVGVEGIVWHDWRASYKQHAIWQVSQAYYVFEHAKFRDKMQAKLPSDAQAILYDELATLTSLSWQQLVLVEPPKNIETLVSILVQAALSDIYLVAYVAESKYIAGTPTREDFAKLYRWLTAQKAPIEIRPNLQAIATQLEIVPTKLKLMFHVFFEAKFVTISDGQVSFNSTQTHTPIQLDDTTAMKQYHDAMTAESILIYQSLDQITKYFEKQKGE